MDGVVAENVTVSSASWAGARMTGEGTAKSIQGGHPELLRPEVSLEVGRGYLVQSIP